MKNIYPSKKLPINTKKQRLVIYKKALKYLSTKEEGDFGLCIELKELSGISFYDSYQPKTDELFPEFGMFIKRYQPIKFLKLLHKGNITNKWRIKVLNECIKICEK